MHSNIKLILLDWITIGKGSVILIHPDGAVVGSPSVGEDGCVTHLGNLFNTSLKDMWAAYPYKDNHISKCVEESIYRYGQCNLDPKQCRGR